MFFTVHTEYQNKKENTRPLADSTTCPINRQTEDLAWD